MNKSNFESAKKFVEMKRRHNEESLSGPGSWIAVTGDAVNFIDYVIKKYNIKSILDLGCGDWNWFNKVDLSNCSYIGWDADELMIGDNQSEYGAENISFFVKDIFNNEYPPVDLIICRDVLFHVELELSTKLINNVKQKSKFFLSTCHRNINHNSGIKKYCNIEGWGFFDINLNTTPFNLLDREIEYQHESKLPRRGPPLRRYLSLYDFRE